MLIVNALGKSFGGLRALDGLALSVEPGEVVGLIGPNGSGKTTTINVLTGVYRASSGSVTFAGVDLTNRPSYEIARAGIARTFQNLRLFSSHTVSENIRAAQTAHCSSFGARFSIFPNAEERRLRTEADDLMGRFSLGERRDWPAQFLSYGEKKRLEVARALALRPKLLLLDEPAAGMNPVELDWMVETIRSISASGVAIILIEHHMKLVMGVCHRIVVLNFGKKIAEGQPDKVARLPDVIEAYLGKSHVHA